MSRRRIRSRPRPNSSLLNSREAFRIGSLLMLLAVMGLMYFRARDPDTWRWFASPPKAVDGPVASAEETGIRDVAAKPTSTAPASGAIPGPDETDAEQQQAFQEAAQAITDNRPLATEEMFAYWRLFEWAQHSTFSELWRRAKHDVLFAQLFGQPHLHRGELIAIHLHVRRILPHPPDPREAERPEVFEAWGATDDSRTFPYCVIFPDAPGDLPTGDSLEEDAEFAGYFLKVMRYEDKLGKIRGAPLLIGRLQWRPAPALADARTKRSPPVNLLLAALGFGAFLLLRWWMRPRNSVVPSRSISPPEDESIERWLDVGDEHLSERPEDPPDFRAPPAV